jgi:hypothetical protein
MDSKEFIKALRTLIREEVRAAVRDEIKALNETKTVSKPKLTAEAIWESMGSTTSKSTGAHTTTPKPKKFVKDPLLNELLNDTASNPIQLTEGYDTIGSFSAEMAQGFGMMRNTDTSINTPAVAPVRDLDGRAVNMNNEKVATVVNAMTKDYSALMKAIDKKKGKA